MNKLFLGIAAVVIIAVIVGGGFSLFSNSSTSSEPQVTPTPTMASAQANSSSLTTLLTSQPNQQCTFSGKADKTSGTIYIGEGEMKGDFAVVTNNVSISSHMLTDGTDMYIWMDGQGQGVKMSITDMEKAGQNLSPEIQNAIPFNNMIDYTCSAWTPDEAMFVVPTTVTFINPTELLNKLPSKDEINSMMENVKENGALNTAACAACDRLSGDQQAQCKQLAGCQ